VKPHGFDPAKKYPLDPQRPRRPAAAVDRRLPRRLAGLSRAPGYVVAFANPTGSNGYGQPFCDAIRHDYGGRVFRDLMKVTDELEKLSFVDAKRMGAMGWSYGGYMMMWMQGQTDRFACQAAMMGIFDLDSFYGATEELWFPEHDLGMPVGRRRRTTRAGRPRTTSRTSRRPRS
jgi:dipeptidyl aminopeptidase/acylaminoacyl peptidase